MKEKSNKISNGVKLLIITQIIDVNDSVLGFMHGWIEEFSKKCEKLTIICLQKGEYNLPDNVKILSLGKESGYSRLKYIFRFYKYIWQERNNYDAVFVHMNSEYVVLGGLLWRLWNKEVSLWYAHGHVPFSLKIAEKLVNIIFTSTKSGCRIKSNKIKVIGQGIDVNKFKIKSPKLKVKYDIFKIISIGRISPSKDYATLIKAVEILKDKGIKLSVEIIGSPATEADKIYFQELNKLIEDKNLKDKIKFIGPVANKNIVSFLQNADFFVNMGQTGSLDKAMVEAMACGLPILTCNEALEEVLGDYQEELMYPKKDYRSLAEKIEYIFSLSFEQYKIIGKDLRNIVVANHSLENLIVNIINIIRQEVAAGINFFG